MFNNAKIGDKVWEFNCGWGEIVSIMKDESSPIYVKFETPATKYVLRYTVDGRRCQNSHQVLFWNKFKIPKEAYKKPLPDLKVDTKVLVWNNDDIKEDGSINKSKRHFKLFREDGKIVTFPHGTTSWSVYSYLSEMSWDNWELAEK